MEAFVSAQGLHDLAWSHVGRVEVLQVVLQEELVLKSYVAHLFQEVLPVDDFQQLLLLESPVLDVQLQLLQSLILLANLKLPGLLLKNNLDLLLQLEILAEHFTVLLLLVPVLLLLLHFQLTQLNRLFPKLVLRDLDDALL